MEMSAATWLWILAAVALAVLLITLATLAAGLSALKRRAYVHSVAGPEAPAGSGGFADDDLPGFLEQPPGSAAAPSPAADGWTALAPPPAPPADRIQPARPRRGRLIAVAGLAALVLVAAAIGASVAAPAHDRSPNAPAAASSFDGRPGDREPWTPPRGRVLPTVPATPSPGDPGAGALAGQSVPLGRNGLAADLTFGGVVLERRAVGVTVAYPRIRLTAGGTQALASVELPVYNCLADTAPDDPLAAGCSRTVTQYAELPTPALHVTRRGHGPQLELRITGRFPTYTRPNGTPPVWTGFVYALTVTAAPDGSGPGRQVPATGELRLGDDTAAAVAGRSLLRYRG